MIEGKAPVLVLVAHGSEKRPQSTDFLHDLARDLREQGAVSSVTALFMGGQPSVTAFPLIVGAAEDAPVGVVPVFMGRGYYTDELVPAALRLQRCPANVIYADPVGCHPAMPDLIAAKARSVAKVAGLEPGGVNLMLVAHGSSRPGGSGDTPKAMAQAIASSNVFAAVETAFLEQDPRAETWRTIFPEGDVVVVPLVLSQGLHGTQDIPAAFGFGPEGGARRDGGRTVALASGLGLAPELSHMVMETALTALHGR
jgi:sirohydrochlorin cobaltochelatase